MQSALKGSGMKKGDQINKLEKLGPNVTVNGKNTLDEIGFSIQILKEG